MSSLSGFAVLDAPVTPRVRVRSWHHRSGPTEFPAGTHAFVEVAWVLEGRATYTVGDRELVAGHKVEHIVTRTIDDAMIPTPQLDAPFLGVLPTGYLRHFLMTVDYPAGKLRLDGYADLPPREPDSFFALGIGFEQVTSPPIHVTQVLPGSSAADEGIAVGDELVKVGGADFASLTPYQRPWAMIDQSEHTAVPVTVLRAGKTISVTLETRKLLTDPKLD